MGVPVSNKQTELVTLGAGNLWVNGVDVGQIKGNVVLSCERTYVPFKPADELGPVKHFRTGENYKLTCQVAELKLSNFNIALGVTANTTDSYRPTGLSGSLSFDTTASDKWDSRKFGGSKTLDTFALKFEHTRPNGHKVVICFYKAQCLSNIDLAFNEEEITLQALEFSGLTDSTRSVGDKVGIMFDQTS